MDLLCLYEGHKELQMEISIICLSLDCTILQRKMCQQCLHQHFDHSIKCVEIKFLKTIIKKDQERIIKIINNIQNKGITKKFEDYLQKLNIFIIELEKEIYYDLKQIIETAIKCYNGLIEQELINLALNENSNNDQIQSIIKIIQEEYQSISMKHLSKIILQQGFILLELKQNEAAYQRYQTVLELVSSHNLSNIYREKLLLRAQTLFAKLLLLKEDFSQARNQFDFLQKYYFEQKDKQLEHLITQDSNYLLFYMINSPLYEIFNKFIISLLMKFDDMKLNFGFRLLFRLEHGKAFNYFSQIQNTIAKPSVLVLIGKILSLFALQKFNECYHELKQGLKIFIDNEYLLLLIVAYCYIFGLSEKVDKILKKHPSFQKDHSILFFRFFFFLEVNEIQEAYQTLISLSELQKQNALYLYIQGLIYRENNQNEEAANKFNIILKHHQQYLLKISLFRLKGQFKEAENLINKFYEHLKIYEASDILFLEKLSILYETRQFEKIEDFCNKTKTYPIDKFDAHIYLIKALSQFQMKNYQNSLEFLKKIKSPWHNSKACAQDYLEGQIHYQLRDFENAKKCFEKCDVQFSGFKMTSFCKATIYCQFQYYSKAIFEFNKVLQKYPNYWQAIYNKGLAFFYDNNLTEAENCFTQLQQCSRAKLLLLYCNIYQANSSQLGKALGIINKYMLTEKKYKRQAVLLKIAVLLDLKSFQDAQEVIKSSNSILLPKHKYLISFCEAIIFYKLNQQKSLKQWISQALTIPELKVYCYLLEAQLLIDKNENEQALELFLKCQIVQPKCLYALDQASELLKKNNRIQEAEGLQHKIGYMDYSFLSLMGEQEDRLCYYFKFLCKKIKYNTEEFANVPNQIDIIYYQVNKQQFSRELNEIFRLSHEY